jgi:hypothetical protein
MFRRVFLALLLPVAAMSAADVKRVSIGIDGAT